MTLQTDDEIGPDVATKAPSATDGDADLGRGQRWFVPTLLGITALALAWRVIYVLVWRQGYELRGDPLFYHLAGNFLADGLGWINPYHYVEHQTMVQAADHPPLYILYLATFSWLGFTGVNAHMLASTLIGALTVYVAGLAGRQIGGWRLGLVAAVIVAAYPNIWNWDGLVLSETMAICGVTFTIWLAYRFWRNPSMWGAAALGLAVGVAAMSRAELLLLSVLSILPVMLGLRREAFAQRVKWVAVAALGCLVAIAPWVSYNMTRFEQPVLLSNGFEITLATANCPETFYGSRTGYWSLNCAFDYMAARDFDESTGDQSVRAEILREETLDFLSDEKGRLPVVVLARWGRITNTWNPGQQMNLDAFNEQMNLWVVWSGLFTWYPLALLAVAGGVTLRRRGVPVMPLAAAPIIVLIVVTIFFGQGRYRAIAEPAVAILAAVAIEALWREVRRRVRSREPAPS